MSKSPSPRQSALQNPPAPAAMNLGDIEARIRRANAAVVAAEGAVEKAAADASDALSALNDLQRTFDLRSNELRNGAHGESQWKR